MWIKVAACMLAVAGVVLGACLHPQKGLLLSYSALSKRDTLPNLFTEINGQMERFEDVSYSVQGVRYQVHNLHPQMYYSEHHQVERYLGTQTATQMTPGLT